MAWFGLMLVLVCSQALCADPLDVCEALAVRDVSGNTVSIRGVWARGDAGQHLRAPIPRKDRTVRDGWLFTDTIELVPANGDLSVSQYVREFRRLLKENEPIEVKIIATLGTFETREHFTIKRDAFGFELPKAYRHSAAVLRFWRADNLNAKPLARAELDEETQRASEPWPRRLP